MYELKRLLNSIIHDSSVVGAPANIPLIRDAAQQALAEIERIEKEDHDAPQEMRDLFAAAALITLSVHNDETKIDFGYMAFDAWNLSNRMMEQRAEEIEKRRGPQPEPKDSIGE
jgi:hypothetical protein